MPPALKPLLALLLAPLLLAANAPAAAPTGTQAAPPSATAQGFRAQCDSWLADLDKAITALERVESPRTVARVLEPLNAIQTALFDGASQASLYEAVHPDEATRDAAGACTSALSDMGTRLSLSRPIYEAVVEVDVAGEAADTRRYHDITLRAFRLAGVDKDEQTRARVRELNDRITRLGQAFDKNILEDVRYIEVDPADLAGLPEDFMAGKKVEANGKVRISTRYVDIIPVYTYAHSDEVRRLLRQQERSRGYPRNDRILSELLGARHELAGLLGFASYADLITADKMVGNATNAQGFIDRFHELITPAAERDMAALLTRLRQIEPEATEVQRWQATYLEELVRREQYQVDAAEIRQYFPYARVRDGIFALVENLFAVEIIPWRTDTWHPSVESYAMRQNGEVIAYFHLDMHPRDGKYQHAAAFSTQVGIAGKQLPISTLVCNFAGGEDPMAVMEFSEVRTFLHEFGHLLHALFGGQQRWATLSGIATEWDFVEAPSQMLEEWMYDPATLQSFAINSAGETIPEDSIRRLNAARHFGEGLMGNLQIFYAALSLAYHRDDPASFSLLDRMLELEAHYSPMPHQEDTYFYANLGHLNGYSAIYYTYMWSKVIAVDLFSEFARAGLDDRAVAVRFRDRVLAPGGSKPAAQLVEDFLGRPYSFDAFAASLEGGNPAQVDLD
ncbi:MAG: M3 family metallopeptidase [Porticoccaceae bacterium]|jgi:thimet oligopeptidase|nr:M3 family metallopeptidase [Porticoccaceae bacterium]HLS98457.1 M3 family metallopeptidase [Porticoccaceae bacterium]